MLFPCQGDWLRLFVHLQRWMDRSSMRPAGGRMCVEPLSQRRHVFQISKRIVRLQLYFVVHRSDVSTSSIRLVSRHLHCVAISARCRHRDLFACVHAKCGTPNCLHSVEWSNKCCLSQSAYLSSKKHCFYLRQLLLELSVCTKWCWRLTVGCNRVTPLMNFLHSLSDVSFSRSVSKVNWSESVNSYLRSSDTELSPDRAMPRQYRTTGCKIV